MENDEMGNNKMVKQFSLIVAIVNCLLPLKWQVWRKGATVGLYSTPIHLVCKPETLY